MRVQTFTRIALYLSSANAYLVSLSVFDGNARCLVGRTTKTPYRCRSLDDPFQIISPTDVQTCTVFQTKRAHVLVLREIKILGNIVSRNASRADSINNPQRFSRETRVIFTWNAAAIGTLSFSLFFSFSGPCQTRFFFRGGAKGKRKSRANSVALNLEGSRPR